MKPFVDIAAADAAIDAIWRSSWIGRTVQSLVCRVQIAWLDSRCRRWLAAAGIRR